jgi:hypothetical protein
MIGFRSTAAKDTQCAVCKTICTHADRVLSCNAGRYTRTTRTLCALTSWTMHYRLAWIPQIKVRLFRFHFFFMFFVVLVGYVHDVPCECCRNCLCTNSSSGLICAAQDTLSEQRTMVGYGPY